MKQIILKANQSRFTKWELFALVAVVIGLFALVMTGCKSTQTITRNPDGTSVTNTVNTFDVQKAVNAITIAVPGTVRLSVARYPQVEPYLRDTVTAIRLLTSGNKYDPASLHAAIATTHIRELQSDDVQAAIDTIAGLYKAYYGDVVEQKLNQVDSLVPILNAIADSIEIGLASPSDNLR
jgi:hypothetical protein